MTILVFFPYYFQCTEHESEDREDLIEAVNIMADVAAFINESKRRKDIVDKYKTEEEKTLTRKISKLNMHSIGKKSTRIGQRFLSSIGIESSVKMTQINFVSTNQLHNTANNCRHLNSGVSWPG